MQTHHTEEVLRALLDTELRPEKEVYMKRFGVRFLIRALDGKMVNRIREQASFPANGGNRLDEEKFSALIISNACVVPDFSNHAILDKYGPTPIDAVQNRLLAGEIAKLSTEVLSLSGFGDEDAEVEQIKN